MFLPNEKVYAKKLRLKKKKKNIQLLNDYSDRLKLWDNTVEIEKLSNQGQNIPTLGISNGGTFMSDEEIDLYFI